MRFPSRIVLLACSLVLPGILSEVRPAAAQSEEGCFRPEGVAEAPPPSVTASEVEANPTPENLKTFALEAKSYIQGQGVDQNELAYSSCLFRREGDWKSGSFYVASLTPGGRVNFHSGDMAFGGRKIRDDVFVHIAVAAGLDMNGMFTNPDGGALPKELGGYAVGFRPLGLISFILVAGLDLRESHLEPVVHDPADAPVVTASDVVDRETLKAFVNGAIEHLGNLFEMEGFDALTKARAVFRDERGPWREGSVYLFTVDRNRYIWFHGAFPNLYEFQVGGRATDAVTGEILMQKIIDAALSNPEGEFVEYHFDDPADDSDSVEIPKVAFVRERAYNIPGFGSLPFIFGSGFYTTTPTPGTDMMTTFVPVVLDSRGKRNSHFTSELALTNRGSDAAMLDFTYTAEAGGGSGAATTMLGPHQQMIASNAIDYLRGLEVPIPETGSRIGTLRVDVSGSSDVSAVVRTTTPTAVPEGRAGLAYPGVPEDMGFHEEAVYLCGLRDNPLDRSNVALQNMGADGSITLRTTVFSGNPADPMGEVLDDTTLGPGEFHQFNGVLQTAGKADPRFGGYVRVERVEGMAPFYAYGVINDNANSDGSFVFPVSAASLEGAMGQTLPALVESGAFTTELTLTNFSAQPKVLMFSATHERIEAENNTAGFGPVPMLPGQQLILPDAMAYARDNLGLNVPRGLVVPLIANAVAGDLSGVVIGARVVAQADAQDPTKGQYGVFFTAVAQGQGFAQSAWVDGLQQNEENRSNLALINTGEIDNSASVFELDIYDGETAMLIKTVTMADEPQAMVPARGFRQINGILRAHAPGTTQGYVRIRKVSGANPFLAYGVVNDGGAPGQRTGDGAYIPARE